MTKTKKTTPIKTQAERKREFKARAEAALQKMPFAWINTFVAKYPEYEPHRVYVTNVARGKSYDEEVTEKLEALADLLKP